MMENGYDTKENVFSSIDTLNSIKSDRKKDDENARQDPKKCDSTLREKHLTGFFKNSFKTLSIPKKAVPEKDKNEPSRFLGEGVTFKAKLIGILEVEEARGDRMCQEALFELKMAVRAAGEHKQRINIVIAIDGIRLRDEKSGDCLHHHPVHKISFIAQDVADSRAFGYVFGSPDTSHRFFGIKTDKAASQVVMAMRDLFQAVYELKKREVEMAKQNIEQHQLKYGSSFFLDTVSASSSKSSIDQMTRLKQVPREDTNKNAKNKTQTTSVIADLMDLELELNSLQQGLSQMERLTPSDPFGPSPSLPKEDPFGDSFTPPPCITTPPPAKLPPPPASGERRKVGSTSSAASQPELHWFDKETQDLFSSDKNLNTGKEGKEENCSQESRSISSSRDLYDIFVELDPLGTGRSKPYTDKKDFFQELKNPPKKQLKDLKSRTNETDGMSHSTAASKLLYSEESAERTYDEHLRKYRPMDSDQRITLAEELAKRDDANSDPFETSFANFASFENVTRRSPASHFSAIPRRSPQSHFRQQSPPIHLDNHGSYSLGASTLRSSSNSSKSVYKSITSGDDVDSPSSQTNDLYASRRSPQWNRLQEDTSKQKIVIDLRKVLSNVDDTDKENDSPVTEEAMILKNRDTMSPGGGGDVSSDSFESIPEPPPRPITSPIISQPPPLPPKKLQLPVTLKPPPRPASDRTSHYDYIENYESVGSSRQTLRNGDVQIPPLPAPARKPKFNHPNSDHRDFVRHRPQKQYSTNSIASTESDYYLTPISKSRFDQQRGNVKSSKPSSLNITLSQLTSSGFEDLASILRIPASALSKMTLKEVTECLSRLTEAECQKLEKDMNNRNRDSGDDTRRYHSLKESFDEDATTPASSFRANFDGKFPIRSNSSHSGPASAAPQVDKYAVFRELIDQEQLSSSFNTASPELPEDNEEEESVKAENDDVNDKDNEQTSKDKELDDRYAALRIIDTSKGKEEDGDQRESESDAGVDESKYPSKTPLVDDSSGARSVENSPVAKQLMESDVALENDTKTDIDKLSTKEIASKIEKQSTPDSDVQALVESKISNKEVRDCGGKESGGDIEVGKNWAKFDSEHDIKEEPNNERDSLWQEESKETSHKARPIKYKKQVASHRRWNEYDEDDEEEDFEEDEDDDEEDIEAMDGENELEDDANDDDYGDDSEENWECSKKSLASSWDESSWRENGWSDRDSLYDERDVSPASRFRDQQYHTQKRAYHRKFKSHSKKSGGQPSWDEDASGWGGSGVRRRDVDPPPYREYLEGSERGGYDPRKIRTPERKQRCNPKEENELALLKMMLGKKRLKALEEQLFKHYHDQLSEKGGPQSTSKKYSSKMKGSASSLLFDRQYDELKGKTSRRSGGGGGNKKYYHTQTRPKSAEKGRKPFVLRPEDSEELYVSNIKGRYRRPYSQDELSVSEEDRWSSRKSPTGSAFKQLPSSAPNVRSRQHSQNSPFEDNFAPSGGAYSEFGSDSGVAVDDLKLANTSTTTITTTASSLSNASLLRSRNQPLPHSRYPTNANKTHIANSTYASCDNLKYGRSSRDSSQRQSPFEDDFNASSEAQRNDGAGGEECGDRRRPDDDVFFSNGIVSSVGATSAGTSIAIESSTVNRKARSTRTNTRGPGEPVQRTSSETSHASTSSKYYENVELRKKKSPSDVYGGTMKDRFRTELTVASPKKGKRGGAGGSDTRRHDPFNDNAVREYESRTVPRSGQKARSKNRNATYDDSGSDSTEPGADSAAFAFSDQHSRK